ncbi:MAG: hypothetical protein JST09_16585 [Bacteroidetes bacterium]|nr:hypothetical protein [Bacteroidota bacterium]
MRNKTAYAHNRLKPENHSHFINAGGYRISMTRISSDRENQRKRFIRNALVIYYTAHNYVPGEQGKDSVVPLS